MQVKVQTILAATDLSPPALAAVRRAALLARAQGAKLELVHVIADSLRRARVDGLPTALAQINADVRQSATDDLDAIVATIETEIGIRARAVIAQGKPFAEIAARSEVIDADVVVVGAHGETPLLTPLLGTTAHRVLRVARRPVLLVKQPPSTGHADSGEYKHIMVATDFSDDSLQAARSARRLFPQSDITLFHAYEAPFEARLSGRVEKSTLEAYRQRAREDAKRELRSFAAAANLIDAARAVRHGRASVRVREYAAAISADLIAIGSEELPRLQHALFGSVSLDVVTQAHCDVLLARTRAG